LEVIGYELITTSRSFCLRGLRKTATMRSWFGRCSKSKWAFLGYKP